VVGWVNANAKAAFPDQAGASDAATTLFVACFVIHPERRGRGIATALLARIAEEARASGYVRIEARPSLRAKSQGGNYRGPEALYRNAGFTVEKRGRGALAFLDLT
jgi:GNAT superfamily N-acetyltransferase